MIRYMPKELFENSAWFIMYAVKEEFLWRLIVVFYILGSCLSVVKFQALMYISDYKQYGVVTRNARKRSYNGDLVHLKWDFVLNSSSLSQMWK